MPLPLFPASLEMPEMSSTVDPHRATTDTVASGQRRRGRNMRARRGQCGTIVRKGDQWRVRFYADEEKGRKKKSVPVGPVVGKGRLAKAEAARKGAEIVDKAGVNTQAHLTRAEHPESVETLKQRVVWCQRFHRAWTESKPGSLTSMESHLTKHILPRFGTLLFTQVTEKPLQHSVP